MIGLMAAGWWSSNASIVGIWFRPAAKGNCLHQNAGQAWRAGSVGNVLAGQASHPQNPHKIKTSIVILALGRQVQGTRWSTG